MLTLPPQSRPVVRDPTTAVTVRAAEGVEASQSRCSHLTGPAQSMCYAALYGVYV
jgi:hypothetical protein